MTAEVVTPAGSAPPTRLGRMTLDDDAKQLIVVLAFAVVALLIGYGVKTWTEAQTRSVTVSGVTASVPSSWVTTPAAGDVLFTAFDPSTPGQRYAVSKPHGQTSPAQALDLQLAAGQAVLDQFQVLDRGTTTIGGHPAETATYAYVKSSPGQVPVVIQGEQIAVASSDGGVLIIAMESPARTFDKAVPGFESFAASVKG